MSLGSHQMTVGKSQVYLTPKWLIDALGPFDLDPCAADPRPWDCARDNYTANGLERSWHGLVWLNPPFDRYQVGRWVDALRCHPAGGILLTHARTEAAWFRPIWESAKCATFLSRRLTFCREDGSPHPANSGAPAVLAAFGERAADRLYERPELGTLVTRWATAA
ncbi:MAG: adenine methyltransferase [Patescibacteria group bacterium]|nr:adenine methyltransferase [Patescibacteria group bacterium]